MTEANYRYLTLWHNSVLLLFLGTGSVLNTKGEVEMDSVIMDGRELQCGSVACVQNIKNPVSLARAVLEKVRRQHSTPSLNISDLIYTYLSWELKKRSCLVLEKNKAPVSILLIPPSPQKKRKRKRIWAVRLGVKLSTNSMKNNVFFLIQTDHTLLVGKGANEFAEEIGIHTVPTDSLVTEDAREEWRHFMQFKTTVNVLFRNR